MAFDDIPNMPDAAHSQHTRKATNRDFAVAFRCGFVDSERNKLGTITLSYTFYPARQPTVKENRRPKAFGRL